MKKEIELAKMVEKLKAYRLDMVAEKAGLSYNTVRNIASGKNKNPNSETMRLLREFFKK